MHWRGIFSSYFTLYQVIKDSRFFPLNPTLAPDFLVFKELFVDYRLMKNVEGGGGGGDGGHLTGLLAVSSISQVSQAGKLWGYFLISLHLFRLQDNQHREQKRKEHFYCEFIFLNIYKIK